MVLFWLALALALPASGLPHGLLFEIIDTHFNVRQELKVSQICRGVELWIQIFRQSVEEYLERWMEIIPLLVAQTNPCHLTPKDHSS